MLSIFGRGVVWDIKLYHPCITYSRNSQHVAILEGPAGDPFYRLKGGATFVNLALFSLQISLDVWMLACTMTKQTNSSRQVFKESKSFCVWQGYTEGGKYADNNSLIYTKLV